MRNGIIDWDHVEKRAWRLFEKRFLPKAETDVAQQQIQDQLAGKLARLDPSGSGSGRLERVVQQAADLWARRSSLRKRDVVYLAAALLYFISPLDAVPDVLPGLGYVDDVIVLSAVLSVIVKGLSRLGNHAKESLEEWIDERTEVVIARIEERTDVVFERFEESATTGVQKTVAAIVIGLWGATTAGAISLSVAGALGHYPAEWLTYVVLSAALVVACNVTTGVYYWREYRRLEGQWQRRLAALVASKLSLPHFLAIGLPILVLIGLGVGRLFLPV